MAENFGRSSQADHLRSGVQDQPGQHGETVCTKNIKTSLVQWRATVVPATHEAEAGEWLEPGRWRLHLLNVKTKRMKTFMKIYFYHFGRLRQVDSLNSGVREQPGQHVSPSVTQTAGQWPTAASASWVQAISCLGLLSSWDYSQSRCFRTLEECNSDTRPRAAASSGADNIDSLGAASARGPSIPLPPDNSGYHLSLLQMSHYVNICAHLIPKSNSQQGRRCRKEKRRAGPHRELGHSLPTQRDTEELFLGCPSGLEMYPLSIGLAASILNTEENGKTFPLISAMARSQLTATTTSGVQVILSPQPPNSWNDSLGTVDIKCLA
ncbi:hypothetical protein AAY473_011479 [Plecturocebus cupreus]